MSATSYEERDRLDFGKHAFKPLKQVPRGYLAWLLAEVALTPRFQSELQAELDRRLRQDEAREASAAAGSHTASASALGMAELLRRVHRELTLQHHPDRGGRGDVMVGINLTIDRLKELAGVS